MATSTRRTASERRQHNRWATLQWVLLAVLLIIGTLALFVLLDGGGATHGGVPTGHNN